MKLLKTTLAIVIILWAVNADAEKMFFQFTNKGVYVVIVDSVTGEPVTDYHDNRCVEHIMHGYYHVKTEESGCDWWLNFHLDRNRDPK